MKVYRRYFETKAERAQRSLIRRSLWKVEILLAAALGINLVFPFLFDVNTVQGSSMLPTFHDGEKLVLDLASYHILGRELQRGDVVIFDVKSYRRGGPQRTRFIKRVIGLPGDAIEQRNGLMYVNERCIDKLGYYSIFPEDALDTQNFGRVPQGCIFVCGDNRPASWDSRKELSFISLTAVRGRIFCHFPSW